MVRLFCSLTLVLAGADAFGLRLHEVGLFGTVVLMEPWIDYTLPPELVAQEPLNSRVDARLIHEHVVYRSRRLEMRFIFRSIVAPKNRSTGAIKK